MAGRGRPRKTVEIVQNDNSPILNPVAPDGTVFKEKDDEGGLIQNAPEHRPFNASQRERMESNYEADVLGIQKEPEPVKPIEQKKEAQPTGTEEVKVEEPLRPTIPVKPQEEPVRPAEARPVEPPVTPSVPQPQSEAESEKERAALRRMHEATQETAELRRQLKQALDMMAQIKSPSIEQARQPQPQPQLTPEQKLEMLQADPVGYMEKMEQEAITKAEQRVFGKLEERAKVSNQQQGINNFVSELDKRFRVANPDLNDPLFEPYIEKASQKLALTQEGSVLLVSRPDDFLKAVANNVRPIVESLKSRFTPGTQEKVTPAPGQPTQTQETRERIPASPVVRPSSAQAVHGGPTEEKEETPQDTVNNRRLQQKRIFGQVTA